MFETKTLNINARIRPWGLYIIWQQDLSDGISHLADGISQQAQL